MLQTFWSLCWKETQKLHPSFSSAYTDTVRRVRDILKYILREKPLEFQRNLVMVWHSFSLPYVISSNIMANILLWFPSLNVWNVPVRQFEERAEVLGQDCCNCSGSVVTDGVCKRIFGSCSTRSISRRSHLHRVVWLWYGQYLLTRCGVGESL